MAALMGAWLGAGSTLNKAIRDSWQGSIMPGPGDKKNPGNFLNISFLKRENPYFCSPFWERFTAAADRKA
jgi:hypothetical protein